MHDLFEGQVANAPEQTAVVFEGRTLSYRALNEKANQVAHYLRLEHGVGPDTLVGLCIERSLEMVIGIMGILKAGGAYVPLDPNYPAERLSYLLADTAVDIVLSGTKERDVLGEFAGAVLCLDGMADTTGYACVDYSKENLDREEIGLTSSHLAYVIYTSGSTGQPKGVMVEHHSLVNRIIWMDEKYGLSANDKILQKTPFSFDVSVWEFLWTLGFGAQLIIARPDGHKDPEYLTQLVIDSGVTKLHFVPSMLGVILSCATFNNCTSINQVFCSGEALQTTHVQMFKEVLPNAELHNLYGPTEAAIDVSYWDCANGSHQSVPIGKPIYNTQLIILDPSQNIVPFGVVGELYIGGVGLARGYHNNEVLTREKFIENPYFDKDRKNSSKRLYRTGDLASLRADGEVEYQGRTDHQVKIRGMRIELGEIEYQLGQLTEVDSALVTTTEAAGSAQLLAYIKTKSNHSLDTTKAMKHKLRTELAKHLPLHMVPELYIYVEEWPLTPNGKINRSALPKFDVNSIQVEIVKPVNDIEVAILNVFAELLQLPNSEISMESNLFELGGHSLLVPTAISKLSDMGYLLSVANIYRSASLKEMAELVIANQNTYIVYNSKSLVPIGTERLSADMFDLAKLDEETISKISATVHGGASNIQDILPLLTLQHGFLFQHLANPAKDPSWQSISMRVNKDEIDTLISSFNSVIVRHDALRSVFIPVLPVPVSVVLRKYQIRVDYHELSNVGDPESQMDYITHDYNIDTLPPMLLIIGTNNQLKHHHVRLVTHHLMLDHEGANIVLEELVSVISGNAERLAKPVPYKGVVAHIINANSNDEDKNFFAKQLAGFTNASNIVGISQANFSGEVTTKEIALDAKLEESIRTISKQHNYSPATFFHTAFAMLMSVLSKNKDVAFGTVFSGRQNAPPGSENAVGMLMNTLPFRVNTNGCTLIELYTSVAEKLVGYLSHEHFPIGQAKALTQLKGSESLINGVLNYRYGFATETAVKNHVIDYIGDEDKMGASSPIILAVTDNINKFHITLKVDSKINVEAVFSIFKYISKTIVSSLCEEKITNNVEWVTELINASQLLVRGREPVVVNEQGYAYKKVKSILCKLLGVEHIDANENLLEYESFYDVAKIAAAFNKEFSLDLEPAYLIDNNSVGHLVLYLENVLVSEAYESKLLEDNYNCGVI
ncbi:non-ribosomal peptide synthetase [Pseudoalteromonas sp. CO348]|uniref:non-ribosomal peptide synthetase n=1 Tax=Pseudoalteromonas sp. CO348 TaxID=1777271 RepID=UPI0023EA5739|nr:non-ribosomal peptide synthetase [Pseudoalteromonas sp. CO348]